MNSIDRRLARLRAKDIPWTLGPYRSERTELALELVLIDDVPIPEAAKLCGVSRATVYHALKVEGVRPTDLRTIAM